MKDKNKAAQDKRKNDKTTKNNVNRNCVWLEEEARLLVDKNAAQEAPKH